MVKHRPSAALVDAIAKDGRPLYAIGGEALIAPTEIGHIVKGRALPTDDQARRLATVLGVAADELFSMLAVG